MGIQNFPAALQPIIQQGFLEREFQQALKSRLGYRACADRVKISVGIGETLTRTRAGLKPSITTPLAASTNTNLDNGMTPTGWGVEQYTITINHYAATTDLNMVTSRVGIASQFLQNAYVNGEQAARSLDELARNALFSSYFGGNTRVRTTLGSPGTAVTVDDVRGFQNAFVNGVQQPVGASNPLTVTVGANAYTLVGVTADVTNVSTAPNGVSGVADLLGQRVGVRRHGGQCRDRGQCVGDCPAVATRHDRGTDCHRHADNGAACWMRSPSCALNAVPEIDGVYNCYLDPVSARQLFADPDFKQLFQGATSANQVFRQGMTNDFLGLRFIPTTEAFVQAHPTLAGLMVRRPIVCGQGALIEGDFAGMAAEDVVPKDSIVAVVDDVAMVTREPIDRLQQIIAQSWYWIGGFCAPSDTTTNPTTIPTATNAAFKRAVMVEHIG